jgi:hypothetical protein
LTTSSERTSDALSSARATSEQDGPHKRQPKRRGAGGPHPAVSTVSATSSAVTTSTTGGRTAPGSVTTRRPSGQHRGRLPVRHSHAIAALKGRGLGRRRARAGDTSSGQVASHLRGGHLAVGRRSLSVSRLSAHARPRPRSRMGRTAKKLLPARCQNDQADRRRCMLVIKAYEALTA